ncbi:MAG: hypothetical protein QOG20_514 [Pseudonocardiales bacterium]|nr:hypothetical protein [Pseudonocardiales bacterium]
MAGEQIDDVVDQRRVRAALPAALEQGLRGDEQERREDVVGFGEIQRAVEGLLGGAGIAEHFGEQALGHRALAARELGGEPFRIRMPGQPQSGQS